MAWYRTGTVAVTNGSTTITGTGTAFVGAVERGDGFVGPDGRSYEIMTVISATVFTLAGAYLGATQSGAAYAIFPTQSRVIEQAAALDALISNYQSVYDGPGQGRFADGTAGAPGVGFVADGDTGLRRTGANALALVGGGVDLLTLSSAGAVLAGKLTGAAAQTLGPVLATYGGTANAIALTYGVAAVTLGTAVRFKASATNTGAATINLDGKGAVACRTVTGAVLPAGYIRTDTFTTAVYDGTYWVVGRETERGSNANGEYVRFADNTQICWSPTIIYDSVTIIIGAGYRSTDVEWVFPATFSDGQKVVVSGQSSNVTRWPAFFLPSILQVSTRLLAFTSWTGSETARYTAIGPWY